MKKVQIAVGRGVSNGFGMQRIAQEIREETGTTKRRSKLIARDQTAKLVSDIDTKRQADLGIEYYEWLDSRDERESGNPNGKYPNAKIKCWYIAKMDVGYGPGIFRLDEGASYAGETHLHPGKAHIECRCRKRPMIPGIHFELPDNKKPR